MTDLQLPHPHLMDVATVASRLETIDVGFQVGELSEEKFVELVNQWLSVVIEHPSDRLLQVGFCDLIARFELYFFLFKIYKFKTIF